MEEATCLSPSGLLRAPRALWFDSGPLTLSLLLAVATQVGGLVLPGFVCDLSGYCLSELACYMCVRARASWHMGHLRGDAKLGDCGAFTTTKETPSLLGPLRCVCGRWGSWLQSACIRALCARACIRSHRIHTAGVQATTPRYGCRHCSAPNGHAGSAPRPP